MNEFASGVSPKRAFIGGIAVGVLVLCTVGFFILLGVVLKGSGTSAAPLAVAGDPSDVGQPSAPPAGPLKAVSKDEHILGPKDAKVTIVEYSDFECPFCKVFHQTMRDILAQNKDVRWVYRHYPLSFHANAQKEAEASECAADLGGNDAFWKFGNTLLERTTSNGTGFALDALVPLAKEIGLNESKFKKCLDDGKFTSKVNKDLQEGQAAGVQGTPGNFVVGPNGTRTLPGAVPASSVQAAIDGVK